MNRLLFADDFVIMAKSGTELEIMISELEEASSEVGLVIK